MVQHSGNILVCVDGSDYTEPSLQHACWLGERVGAAALVVRHISDVGQYQVPFVNELGAGIGLQPCNGLFGEIHRQEQERLEGLSKRVELELKNSVFADRYRFVVERGRPLDVFTTSPTEYTHVVFGKRGESFSYDQNHLGSNLGKFLKNVSVPCLLSSRAFSDISTIGLVFDSGCEWKSAVDYFLNAKGFHSLTFHLIHFWEEDAIPEEMRTVMDRFKSLGIKHTLKSMLEKKESAVIDFVQKENCDLLALGAKSMSSLHWISSTVAKSIVKQCRIPIVVCRD